MIDCLSNPGWINPQIDFLLFLQNFRLGHLEFLDKFFLSVTILGEVWLPTLICAIVYWCIDFRAGIYLFSLESFNIFITHFLKMLACVYRPWILSDKLQPSKLAVPFAKGYSFPSGHTATSTSVFGGLAYLVRKKKIFVLLLIGIILLVGFSRLWLGVHTPQDVICGLIIGIVLIFGLSSILKWAEEKKHRFLYLIIILNVLVLLAFIYINYFMTFRMDYVDGKLLVNPLSTKHVTFAMYAYALGLINGCFLCKQFFPFDPKEASVKKRIVRGIIGSIGLIILLKVIFNYLLLNAVDIKIAATIMFIMGIIITLIYPIIFTKLKI